MSRTQRRRGAEERLIHFAWRSALSFGLLILGFGFFGIEFDEPEHWAGGFCITLFAYFYKEAVTS